MPRLYDTEYKTLADIGVKGSKDAIVACVEQGTEAWFGARLGVVSASNASTVVTTKGAPSTGKTRLTYMHTLIVERLTRQIQQGHSSLAMERGTENEPKARKWYEFETGRDVQDVGFIYKDDNKAAGCSPDGLCSDRGIEIKVPLLHNHLGNLLYVKEKGRIPTGYVMQVQYSMWVTGLPKWDWVSFCPEPHLYNVIVTVERDEALMQAFDIHIPVFCAEMVGKMSILNNERETK